MQVKLHDTARGLRDEKSGSRRGGKVDNLREILLLPVFQSPFWSGGERNALLNLER